MSRNKTLGTYWFWIGRGSCMPSLPPWRDSRIAGASRSLRRVISALAQPAACCRRPRLHDKALHKFKAYVYIILLYFTRPKNFQGWTEQFLQKGGVCAWISLFLFQLLKLSLFWPRRLVSSMGPPYLFLEADTTDVTTVWSLAQFVSDTAVRCR